ncbi:gluconate 2-dehydrogenase subunit 3 family protein [Aureibaculum sp. A20]|uniref:Gluconate 2-dehydrogenase subunit 3 family protein n=1 Tax=Aureibaculum flavum TaxID=2795986 RepID=A0ABS0WSL4_9FLAO|nr:gluconate 2-dehydrogenase subunit 3 family protein [Aureibaculum flavum]MBJ2174972.1 gluconate 2-dehydrogenase subunit 3 family protein [Aureibaculum flavum]
MNRRDAIKGLGLSLGYVVATPAIVSMLQGCKTEVDLWKPVFLSVNQGYVLRNLVDLILPTTDTSPGALDVNVPEFIDVYVSKTATVEGKEDYKNKMDALLDELGVLDKNPTILKPSDFENMLSKYLRSSSDQQSGFTDKEKIAFDALKGIRGRAVWAYRTSEEIGENVLAYDPVPGVQKGCISIEETKGKAWSL